MEFYDEKDMEYWRKQADLGKAVILEIPVSMLLDLDIRSLSEKQGEKTSMEDLDVWLSRNRDDIEKALENEKKEKKAVEMLEESLYDGSNSEKKKDESDHSKQPELSDAAAKVSRIMATETFSEDQIAVIAEAMLEKLPDRFLLLFMRKEYSPKVMRQIKDYCTGQYQKEVSGNNEGKQEMDPADFEPSAI